MKPFEAQTYYELLEVSVSSTRAEIEAAFTRLARLYGGDQMSLYGLVEVQRAKELKSRLDEALQILTSEDLRAEYDKRIGLPPREVPKRDVGDAQLVLPDLLPNPPSRVASTAGPVAVSWVPSPEAEPPGSVAVVGTAAQGLSVASGDLSGTPSSSGEAAGASQPSSSGEPTRGELPPASTPAPARADSAPPSQQPAPPPPEPAAIVIAAPPAARPKEPEVPPEPPRPTSVDIPDGAVFNGALLRRVREARGLSLQVVSDRTRIGVRHLENVEADRYGQLPASVYLRGMLMSLSRELGIDGLKVSKSYLSLVEQAKG